MEPDKELFEFPHCRLASLHPRSSLQGFSLLCADSLSSRSALSSSCISPRGKDDIRRHLRRSMCHSSFFCPSTSWHCNVLRRYPLPPFACFCHAFVCLVHCLDRRSSGPWFLQVAAIVTDCKGRSRNATSQLSRSLLFSREEAARRKDPRVRCRRRRLRGESLRGDP